MRIPKRYGQSKTNNCPFCDKVATAQNKQGIPVCRLHKDASLDCLKCLCGEYLDVFSGKWGPYFRCMNCGNINFKKGLSMNPTPATNIKKKKIETRSKSAKKRKKKQTNFKQTFKTKSQTKKEITITSDELDFMF